MFAIYKKELRSYFINAIGYVYVGVFLAAAALLCCYTTLGSQSYDTSTYFTMLIFAFIILIPLLTMKLFAEEKKLRTEQLLLTAPVSIWEMVLGKFLAAFTLFFGTVVVSCINFFPLYSYARAERANESYSVMHVGPVTAEILSCLIGIILIGAAFIAIGLFVSSLTENQLAAAVGTIAIILLLLAVGLIGLFLPTTYWLRFVFDAVSIFTRFQNFTAGYFDIASVVYYLSVSAVFLYLTVRVYDRRRYN